MRLCAASLADVDALAGLHALAFDRPWSAEAIAELMRSSGVAVLIAEAADAVAPPRPLGFVMVRSVLDEAEILTLAVAPAVRRRGVGRGLVEAAAAASAPTLWLEVAADNSAAQALYAAAGFVVAGRRPKYYARPHGAVDALILRRSSGDARA